MTGICAEVRVDGPAVCPIADLSAETGPISSVSRSLSTADEEVTEEFSIRGDSGVHWAELPDAEPVFSYDDETVYRFSRQAEQGCVCEIIEQSNCTVRNVQAIDGSLVLTFLAMDLETIRSVISDLKEAHDGVQIRRLTRSASDDEGQERAVVDMDALTERQHEVLTAAYERGYFEHPRGTSASEVAADLGIAVSTFTEHLAAAQNNLLSELLGEACSSKSKQVEA